jgi:hypothetical protein
VAALIALGALFAPAQAHASASTFTVKGADASAQFGVVRTIPCGTGTSTETTFISVLSFESVQHGSGAPAQQVQTFVSLSQANACTGEVRFDFTAESGGQLPMSGLQTATIVRHITFPTTGAVLDLNLILTGEGATQQGVHVERSRIGSALLLQRSVGSSRAATFSGTASLDGEPLPLTQLTEVAAQLAQNTGGVVSVIRP